MQPTVKIPSIQKLKKNLEEDFTVTDAEWVAADAFMERMTPGQQKILLESGGFKITRAELSQPGQPEASHSFFVNPTPGKNPPYEIGVLARGSLKQDGVLGFGGTVTLP